MKVIAKYFDKSINQCSPVQEDVIRKTRYDEDGKEFVTYEKVDYPAFQQSLGTVEDWSLQSLMQAGINPAFPIHTGNPTRLEGIDVLDQYAAFAEDILKAENESNK